jgi:hypothetical protein
MFQQLHSHPFLNVALVLLGSLTFAASETDPTPSENKEAKPQLRIVCVSSQSEDQEVILASRDENAAWQEHGAIKLRSSLITEWLPAHAGELHLALRGAGELQSICRFTYPEGAKRALVVLLNDPVKKTYTADIIDPGKLKFIKGATLLVNYSPLPGAVVLGSLKTRIKPGERMTIKPEPDANGMYRMMVAYADETKELIPCYDRYVSSNYEARDILLLLPDATLGLKVFSLSEFGPFD